MKTGNLQFTMSWLNNYFCDITHVPCSLLAINVCVLFVW